MPPESIRFQKYSQKSDVWAYGVVLWEVFARLDPYPELDAVATAIEVISHGARLRPPNAAPKEIASLMLDCWKMEPNDRPGFNEIWTKVNAFEQTNPSNYEIHEAKHETHVMYPKKA